MPPQIRRFVRGEGPSDETKRRILEATRAQLKSEPFARFSLEAIARRAGLTRLTVYYQFGSKRGLLEALYNSLAEGGGLMRLPGLYGLTDPAAALMELIAIFCDFWASDRELIRTLAKRLAEDDPAAGRIRATVKRSIAGEPPKKGGKFEALLRSPLIGSELEIKRERTPGRKVEL